jgi:hypothetical protein
MSTVTDDLIGVLTTMLRDKVLSLKGPAQVTVMNKGAFRKMAMIGSEEFIFKGVREGKTSQLIFMLDPVDARGFDYAEFTEKEALKYITDYDVIVRQCLGGLTPNEWRKSTENKKRTIEEKKATAAVEKEKATYGAHDMWGMF